MQDKLKELEIEYSIDWREYRIEDLFKIDRGNISKQGELVDNADGVVFVAQNDSRNGFVKRVYPSDNKVFDGKTIAIGRQTGVVYYQPERFVTTDGVLVLSAFKMIVKSDRIGLYLTSLIQKQLLMYGYTNTVSAAKLKTLKLYLPTQNGEIAFDYIEEFIATLEAERLAMLNEYLLATGLKDITLSKGECSALDRLEDNSVNWREFSLPKLFMIKNTHCILSRDIVKNSGIIPYLTASQSNNAVGTYIEFDKRQIEEGNSIFVGGKTFVVTYQKENYFSNDSHNLALYYKDTSKRTKENQLFMTTAIYKSLSHLYSWGNSISHSKIQKDSVMLPCDDEGKIDFDFMSTLVSAVQKVVIKNVITYIDKQIDMTGKIIKGL